MPHARTTNPLVDSTQSGLLQGPAEQSAFHDIENVLWQHRELILLALDILFLSIIAVSVLRSKMRGTEGASSESDSKLPSGGNKNSVLTVLSAALYKHRFLLSCLGAGMLGIIVFKEHGILFKLNEAMTIAAFVSLTFDIVYHAEVFGAPVQEIKKNVVNIQKVSGEVSQLTNDSKRNLEQLKEQAERDYRSLENLTNELGFRPFQQKDREYYLKASTRIIAISNYWQIDKEWWHNPSAWGETDLYKTMLQALQNEARSTLKGAASLQIIFAGNVPWPVTLPEPKANVIGVGLEDYQFRRFLGAIWYHVVAYKVREAFKEEFPEQAVVPVQAVVAEVPLSATIIDNDVWVIFPGKDKDNPVSARGFHLTKRENENDSHPAAHIQLADTYSALIHRYIRHARSVREYVEALMILAMHSAEAINYSSSIAKQGSGEEDHAYKTLEFLGLERWCKFELDQVGEIGLGVTNKETLKQAVKTLIDEFCNSLAVNGHFIFVNQKEPQPEHTFRHILEDIL